MGKVLFGSSTWGCRCVTNSSKWWKDLVSLAKGQEVDWFNVEVVRSVGNGASTSFWRMAWRGEESFTVKFHWLFTIATNQEATVQDMWMPNTNGGSWNFNWRRRLFVWENNLLLELVGLLDGVVLGDGEDRRRWRLEDDGSFSVKSMYVKLEGRGLREGIHPDGERRVFRQIWKAGAPPKVTAFVWKALLDRIPTHVNLATRNCLPPDIGNNCLWCADVLETSNHLFHHCDLARNF